VPVKRRSTLDPRKVESIAQNMLEVGQLKPILLRRVGARFVLVEGLHRLEACKALGENENSRHSGSRPGAAKTARQSSKRRPQLSPSLRGLPFSQALWPF